MKIRAQITIDMEVEDYVAAAGHQRRVEEFYRQIRACYGDAALQLNPVRTRTVMRPDDRRRLKRRTGALAVYCDD